MGQSPPNVVWISLESIKANRTSPGGYERETTPALASIADSPKSVWLPNCISQARWTPASSASMLTGTYLTTHRVGFDGDDVHRVPDSLSTVSELLGREGYRTGCVSSNSYLSSATGLDRGFDRFCRPGKYDAIKNPGTVLRYLSRPRRYRGLSMGGKRLTLTYDLVTDTARQWIDDFAGTDPFFLYLHYNTSHHPYRPPHSYLEDHLEETDLAPAEAIEVAREVTDNMWAVMAEGCSLSERQRTALRATYDASVAYVDEMVGELFDYVSERAGENTVFVITGDHGELFGEGGVLGHNLVLRDGVTRVPMVVHGLEELAADSDDVVQHIDVTRTVLAAAGADTAQCQGVDLRTETPRAAISQRGPRPSDVDRLLEHNPSFDDSRFHRSAIDAVRTDRFKYLEWEDGAALYRLPDETTDVAAEYPDVRDRLADHLAERRATIDRDPADRERAEFTDGMREQLRDMGYI